MCLAHVDVARPSRASACATAIQSKTAHMQVHAQQPSKPKQRTCKYMRNSRPIQNIAHASACEQHPSKRRQRAHARTRPMPVCLYLAFCQKWVPGVAAKVRTGVPLSKDTN
eukprot:36071-Chlamydomonas_euryale.AAC.7